MIMETWLNTTDLFHRNKWSLRLHVDDRKFEEKKIKRKTKEGKIKQKKIKNKFKINKLILLSFSNLFIFYINNEKF